MENRVEELDADTCLRLIETKVVGRVAMAAENLGPLVVPVNFILEDDVVVFRSDLGEKWQRLHRQPVSFQVDDIDAPGRTGWSVLVRGVAYEATHWEVEHLTIDTWGARPEAALVPHHRGVDYWSAGVAGW